jgi:GntR family transcriptional regulator, carbon starvation induced regulator
MNASDTSTIVDEGPRTQAGRAYLLLKREILFGRFRPNDKLKIVELAEAFEVSAGAMREALSRLIPEGLVVSRDQRGFIVAPLSLDDLDDLTQVRTDIEEMALRRSLARGDSDWEALVLAAAHRLRRTRKFADSGEIELGWIELHDRFHSALVAACGSPQLLSIRAHLHQQTERYRYITAYKGVGRDFEAEHQGIVDAALDRDADKLVTLIRAHFRSTSDLVKSEFGSKTGLNSATS